MEIPNSRSEHPYKGLELDWIGIDDDGYIGVFCSAGFGPVPEEAIQSAKEIDGVEDRIRQLPERCKITVIKPLKEWEEIGKRGIFVFDWSHKKNRYEKVIEPRIPVAYSELENTEPLSKIKPKKLPARFVIED